MGWKRVVLAITIWMVLFAAPPAGAQEDPNTELETGVTIVTEGDEAIPESEIVRDDETSDTIQGLRRNLILIAIVATGGLAIYVWHTSPSRRFRIAAERLRAED